MDHSDDVIISISRLVGFLAAVAEEEGIEVYSGFSARQLIIEDGRVEGVRLGEVGLDAAGGHMANYRPAEEIPRASPSSPTAPAACSRSSCVSATALASTRRPIRSASRP